MKIFIFFILLCCAWIVRGDKLSEESEDDVEFIGHELLESRLDFMQHRFTELFMKLVNTVERNQNLTEQKLEDLKNVVANNSKFSVEILTNMTEQKYANLTSSIEITRHVVERKLEALYSNIVVNNSRILSSLKNLTNVVNENQLMEKENMLKLTTNIASNNTKLSDSLDHLVDTVNENRKISDLKLFNLTANIIANNTKLSDLLESVINDMNEKQNITEDKLHSLTQTVAGNNTRLSRSIEHLAKQQELTDKNLQNVTFTMMANNSLLSRLLVRLENMVSENKNLSDANALELSTRTSTQKLSYDIMLQILSCKALGVAVMPKLCVMDAFRGGWLVIQKRTNMKLSFDRDWEQYRNGFGNIEQGTSFWLGNEAIHQITNSGDYELIIEIIEDDRYGYARYSKFHVAGEGERYRLTVGGYSGSIGDSFSSHDQMEFVTIGRCAKVFACGWWYHHEQRTCYNANLNTNTLYGIFWRNWTREATYSRMMIRLK